MDKVEVTRVDNMFAGMSGTIPKELGNLYVHDGVFNLSFNELRGPIPKELGDIKNLEVLDISSNLLSGSIPPELANLTGLLEFVVTNNELDSADDFLVAAASKVKENTSNWNGVSIYLLHNRFQYSQASLEAINTLTKNGCKFYL